MDDFPVYLITLSSGLRIVKNSDEIVLMSRREMANYIKVPVSKLNLGDIVKIKGTYEDVTAIETVILKRDMG